MHNVDVLLPCGGMRVRLSDDLKRPLRTTLSGWSHHVAYLQFPLVPKMVHSHESRKGALEANCFAFLCLNQFPGLTEP
jgi:hypothetical protein